jgi:hypothetical protein
MVDLINPQESTKSSLVHIGDYLMFAAVTTAVVH